MGLSLPAVVLILTGEYRCPVLGELGGRFLPEVTFTLKYKHIDF